MPPKKGAVGNVIETLGEPVRTIKGDVKKQIGNMSLDLVKMLYIDPEHKFKTDEELEQIEKRERMERLEGFRQSRRELNAMQGKVVSEETIDEETRKYIEEEEERLARNLQKFEITSRETAESLGQKTSQEKTQAEQQKGAAEEQEKQRKEAEEKARLETTIETPHGRETGVNPKFKRRPNPRRGTPRATARLRSAETKLGQGVGG